MKLRYVLAGAVVAAATTGGASAGDLTGTLMDILINHTGQFGEPVGGVYEYGTTDTYSDSFGFTWDASSPAGFPGYDNSILVDFSNFAYGDFANETATVSLDNIDINVLGDAAFFNSNGTQIGTGTNAGDGFSGTYAVNDILAADGVSLVIAWNNVPAPGALALLGAGLLGGRRRRA
jgi:hypothetical protein